MQYRGKYLFSLKRVNLNSCLFIVMEAFNFFTAYE